MDITDKIYLKQICDRIPNMRQILDLPARSNKSYEYIGLMINETMKQEREVIRVNFSEELHNILNTFKKNKIISEF